MLTIKMEERPLQKIIVDSLNGKYPYMMAFNLRKHLFKSNADFEEV